MKNLRKPTFRKVITAFFLINFLSSIFLPNYAFALTGGPHQIEYTSYEEPGATDMVNLLTGDFTYNLPILDIPGPEGSFSLPLSYHAGIGLEQEASWVGLGWTMNPGAIVRNVNEYPDDAKGEAHSVTVQDLNVIRGWESNLGIVQLGWNNQVGHYGSVSLFDLVTASWSGGNLQSVGVAGLTVSADGVTFNPMTFMMAAITVATWGASGVMEGGKFIAGEFAKQAAIDAGIGLVMGAAMGAATPNAPSNGVWKHTKREKRKWFHKEYKIWLDHTRTEDMYGTLYLGNPSMYTPYQQSTNLINLYLTNGGTSQTLDQFVKSSSTGNKGSASDVNYHIDNGKEYYEVNNPSALAYDDYQVNAPGIGGSISPYRFDVGSISMPREMTAKHNRLAPVRWENYKVPFIYEGLPANSYYHHVGSSTSVSAPTPHFGISHSVGNPNIFTNTSLTYNLNDVVLKNNRIRSDINGSKKIALPNHVEWFNNGEIKSMTTHTAKFIDFLYGSGVGSDRYNFRDHFTSGQNTSATTSYTTSYNFTNTFQVDAALWNIVQASTSNGSIVNIEAVIYNDANSRASGSGGQQIIMNGLMVHGKYSNLGQYYITVSSHSYFTTYAGKIADVEITYYVNEQNPDAIGGYMITGSDGTNYHFALPVYDYDTKTEVIDATDPNKRSILTRKAPFANSWLLTAITYPDYIDRNNNGVADTEDWGGWIKLNYGRASDKYDWRAPYDNYKRDPSNKTDTYTSGSKQLYYLNSIETRSHVALFLKSNRSDGKSKNNTYPLKLDEVVVLSQEHYNTLKTTYLVPQYSNKINVICYSNTFNSSSRDFIDKNSIKRVKFTYTYELCPGIPNSTAGGKLTLKNVSILGRGSNNKITPDYKFEYSYNPSYGEHKWDGWGMYNPSGVQSGQSHFPSQSSSTANAWSLSKIITPLGAEIEVNLERDVYNSVSGEAVMQPPISFLTTNVNRQYFGPTSLGQIDNVNHYGSIQAGDNVKLEGGASFLCPNTGYYQYRSFNGIFSVSGVSGNSISINADFVGTGCTPSYGSTVTFEYIQGTIRKVEYDYMGGDVRVNSIVMKDEFGIQNKIRYLYTKTDGTSSGVIGKQNPYAKFDNFSFENLPEMPGTPVMYGRVTVLNGNLADDNDFHTRTVYEFETPHKNLVVATSTEVVPETKIREMTLGYLHKDYVILKEHIIHNYTAKIGSLKSTKVYDKNGVLKSSTDMVYTNQLVNDVGNAYQGIYTQGTIMVDRIEKAEERTWYHKFNRTTILRYANVLKEVINSKDGNTSKSENTKWDFITGNVLEKVETSPLGLKVKSVTVPAYKQTPYAEFGPKALSLSNKNMLSQVAEQYTYLLDANGAEVGLLGASAQTWKKNWGNYRIYSGGTYTQGSEGDPVWRKGAAYVWRGDYNRLQPDGSQSFSASDKFNFTSGSSNPGWGYVGETKRYDHFSMPLESKGRDSIYTASKMGYGNKIKILSASNAQYTEVVFSSAEDFDATTSHFGGEIALKSSDGNATVVKKSSGGDSHTGDCAIQLSSGKGFIYKPSNHPTNNTALKPNKTYRVSVWTKSVGNNGRIYYKLNNSPNEETSTIAHVKGSVSGWQLIEMPITIGPTFTALEVGVKSVSGTVLFDDFRFQPVDASMVCYVYNPLTHVLSGTNLEYSEYVLDNDNLYTRYEYNAKGQLQKTFRESIKYNGEKLVSESISDYRRFYINQ